MSDPLLPARAAAALMWTVNAFANEVHLAIAAAIGGSIHRLKGEA